MSESFQTSELFRAGIAIIPEPQQAELAEGALALPARVTVALPGKPSKADRFAAKLLVEELKSRFGLKPRLPKGAAGPVRLKRDAKLDLKEQGYTLTVTPKGAEVVGVDEAGLYYGVQTLIELARRLPLRILESAAQGKMSDEECLARQQARWNLA